MTDTRLQDVRGLDGNSSLPCAVCPVQDFGLCTSLLRQRGLIPEFESVRARRKICHQGDPAEYVHILCEGWAFRFTMLADGRRQILDFLLPGQLVATTAPFKPQYESSVQSLTPARIARIPRLALVEAMRRHDELLLRLTELCVADLDRLERSLADLGRRSALERVARLLLSLYGRMAERGRVDESGFEFPVRQEHLADATGLTPIHVGRMLRQLRDRKVIRLQDRRLQVLDMAALERSAEFVS